VCCPRSALKHALAALKLAHGVRLLVGFELEFMLLKPAAADATVGCEMVLHSSGGCFRPIDESIYCQSSAFDQAAPGEGDGDHQLPITQLTLHSSHTTNAISQRPTGAEDLHLTKLHLVRVTARAAHWHLQETPVRDC
jgi:glutamine synthetase